jgi:uncharacterized repeat protein (TIGR01451 family)
MRNSTCAPRPVQRMRRFLGLSAALVSFALLTCGVAAADTVTTDFEAFTLGSVNGQPAGVTPGWKSAPPGSIPSCNPNPTGGAYDQAVVANGAGVPAAFGRQSLRMSNLCGNGEFFFQTYSQPVASPAGETQPNTEFIGQFTFMSKTPDAEQPGLFMSVSPDSYEGSRMSWVGLEDTPGGIQVTVSDTPNVDGQFADYDGPLLDRTKPHTIRFWIKVNPGPDNDLVRIFVDGVDLGQCFTTWENYYRTAPEQAPPPNVNTPADISSLQFRTSVQGPAALATTGGYLFDNVTTTTANGPGPPGCDVPIVKQADTRAVRAGGLAGFQITVRNRGSAIARNIQVCDRIPRRMRFVRADRTLRALGGRGRCIVIPRLRPGQRVSFHLVLRVAATAPAGTMANIADVTPGTQPSAPGVPGAEPSGDPAAPGARPLARAVRGTRVRVRRARAAVRILARRARPNFTG